MTALTATPELAADLAPIASLAMYDPPPFQHANDTLWEAIVERLQLQGFDAPPRLTRDVDLDEVWGHPGLLLGQACAYPLVTKATFSRSGPRPRQVDLQDRLESRM